MPMLRWIIVLRLQQRCKELRNDASSQLEAIDTVWCKLIEYCSQMPKKRFTNAGLEAISESQLRRMQPVHTDDSHNRTYTHCACSISLFFSEKRQNVCVRTTRNIDIKNDGLISHTLTSGICLDFRRLFICIIIIVCILRLMLDAES